MPESRQHHGERFTVMTAYQFAFYTFNQIFEAVSLDRASVWKAGVVIGIVEVWIGFTIVGRLGLLGFAFQHPILPLGGAGLIIPLQLYYVFDRNDRWKYYANQFKHYSRRELIIGRVVLGVVVVLSFVAALLTALP